MNDTASPALTITANPTFVNVRAELPTIEAAREFAALFPRAAKMRAEEVSTGPGRPDYAIVSVTITTAANGVNGGTNETGIKRLAGIRRAAAKHGIEIIEK